MSDDSPRYFYYEESTLGWKAAIKYGDPPNSKIKTAEGKKRVLSPYIELPIDIGYEHSDIFKVLKYCFPVKYMAEFRERQIAGEDLFDEVRASLQS